MIRTVLATGLLLAGTATLASAQPAPAPRRAQTLEEATPILATLSASTVRPYATRDFGAERNPQAISVLVPESRAEAILGALRLRIGSPLVAFIGTTRNLTPGAPPGHELVIARGQDQFDILRIAQTDAVNHDLQTEDLIRKLRRYHRDHGIDIFQAETDTVQFRLMRLPRDMKAFCRDLYRFCPDIVDQGAGSLEALQRDIEARRTVFLWWD